MENSYKVVILGKVVAEFGRAEVIQRLCTLFNSTPEKMEGLLQGKEVPLKTIYTQQQAEQIQQQILQTGVLCEIRSEAQQKQDLDDDRHADLEKEFINSRVFDTNRSAGDKKDSGDSAVPPGQLENGSERLIVYMRDYVGSNIDYYCQQFAKFGHPNNYHFSISWHWSGFFFLSFWALYRKQWGLSGLNALISLSLLVSGTNPVWLALWMSLRGVTTNYIYFYLVRKRVLQAIRQKTTDQISRQGGTNGKAVFWGIIGYALVALYTINYKVSIFVENNAAELSKVAPDSASQTRGDGSLVMLTSDQSNLAIASLSLSYMAIALKIIEIFGRDRLTRPNLDQFIDRYIQGLDKRLGEDPWGQPYRLGRINEVIKIKSAGPDGVFDSDDDIIQLISM